MTYNPSPDQQGREKLYEALTGRKPDRDLDITDDGLWTAETACTAMKEAFRAAEAGHRIRVTEDGRPVAMITPVTRDSGPDLLRAVVYGNSYPALIEAAEAEARGFYGPDAPLAVEHVGSIFSTIGGQAAVNRGAYNTTVTIRCTRLPEGWDVP